MRPRNPGITQAAIDAAGEMLRLLQGARKGANVTGDKRDGFVRWCDNYARPQMRSLFAPTEHRPALSPDRPLPDLGHRERAGHRGEAVYGQEPVSIPCWVVG
jgi:hypothetical protein